MREYRGPAFKDRRRSDKVYRSPAFQKKQDVDNIYRSPAFKERDSDDEELYRSPAFRDQETSEEIYRAPGFQSHNLDTSEEQPAELESPSVEEHDLENGPPPNYREPNSPEEIYTGPAFGDTDPAGYAPSYRRRQMHDVVCSSCGKKAKVPFKPRKDRPVYCKECYTSKK